MKSIQIFKAFFLVLTILMTACNKSEVARRSNEGAKSVEVVRSAQETTDLTKQLAALNLTQIYEESVRQNDPKALLILINQLAGFVLNKEFVEDPSIRSGQIMRTLLGNFNEAFLRVKKLVPSSAETQVILEKYLDIAFAGCDSKSLKNCKNYNFFRTDFRSIDILMFKVKQLDAELVKDLRAQECKDLCSKNIALYYRILNLISDEKNPEKRSEIEFAYLKFSREYAKHITAATPKGEVPPLSVREELAAHASYFESLISKFNGDPKSAGFKEFVFNFKPWSYSRLETDLFPYGTEKMFKYSAQNYLYINNERGARALNPDLAQAILDSQAIGKEDKSGQNFSDSIRDLKSRNPKLLQALGVDADMILASQFKDEYFFIIDRFYRGHINAVEAKEIWQGSNQEKMKLLNKIELYIKVQVITLLDKTNLLLQSIYQQKFEQKNIMIKVLSESSQITFSWSKMISQIEQLNTFISDLFEKSEADKDFKHTSLLLKSVKSNIKYISVYPHMLVLTYFISSLNTDVLNKDGRSQNDRMLRPDQVIRDFFNARQKPWFLFGNDEFYGISKVGIIFSYHFAIMTGTLEGFNPKLDVERSYTLDQKTLFEKVTTKYLMKEKVEIEKAIADMRNNYSASAGFSDALRVCESLSLNQTTGKVEANAVIMRDLEDLEKYASVGNASNGLTGTFRDFYRKNSGNGRLADIVRLDFDRKLVRVQAMVKILEQDQEYINATEEEKLEILNVVKGQVGALEKLKMQYFQMAHKLHKKISNCESLMSKLELQNEYQIYKAEADYLSSVFDVYENLSKSPQNADQILAKANLDFGLTNTDLDSFMIQGYRYSKYSLLLRIKNRLSNMSPKVIVKLVSDPTLLPYYRDSVTLGFRTLNGNLVKREDFVANSMKRLNGINDAYLNWGESFAIATKKNKIEAMTALYKLGFYLGASDRITANEIIAEVFDLIDRISITKEDLQILNWLGISNKLGISAGSRALDELEDISRKNDLKAAFFDSVFVQISTDKTNALEERDPNATITMLNADVFNNILDDAVNLYGTLSSFEEFLIAPDRDGKIKSILMSLYQPAVFKTLAMTTEFRNAVADREKAEPAKELKYLFDLNERGDYSVDYGRSGPIFISRQKLKAYDDTIYDFTEPKTHHCFDTPLCEDRKDVGSKE